VGDSESNTSVECEDLNTVSVLGSWQRCRSKRGPSPRVIMNDWFQSIFSVSSLGKCLDQLGSS
jgi:hypothetical protein